MKLLLRYLKPYAALAIAAPVLMLAEVVMDLMQPTLMARIVDVGIAKLDVPLILRAGALMVALSIVGAVGGIGCTVTASIAAGRMAQDLRHDAFESVMRFSYRNMDRIQTGGVVTRLTNDVTQIENTVRMMLRIMVRAPLMVVGSLVMAIILSPVLGLILVGAAPLILLTFTVIIRRAYPFYMKVQQAMDRINTRVYENLAGVRLVKSFVRQDEEERRFGIENERFADVSVRAGRVTALVFPATQVILYAAVAVVLWIGGVQVIDGRMQIGIVIAVVNYLMQMLWSLIMVSSLIMQISRAQASITRVTELLETRSEIGDEAGRSEIDATNRASVEGASIEFSNVCFGYDGERNIDVLSNVSFTVVPGETVAILGETGSGKSTLVQLIPRLYDVGSGSIRLDGVDVRQWPIDVLRRSIGFAPQEVVLFSGSFTSNLTFADDGINDEAMRDAARIADIASFVDQLPGGYATDINQRGLNLSGGQKQRVSIGRALAMSPRLLILDDATSAVDMATERRILAALAATRGETVIVVAQRIATAMRADRIVLLDAGRVSAVGSHVELMASSSLYREIYESQLGNPEAIDV